MTKIKLGREGQQPFKIAKTMETVSAVHAVLEVDEETGEWWLEDLESKNGTYIRNEQGLFVPIRRERISPDTFICLGSNTALGCTFFAHQVVEYGNFYEDFLYIRRKNEEFDAKLEALEKRTKTIKICARMVFPIAVYFLLSLIWPKQAMEFRFIFSMASSAIVELWDPSRRRRDLIEERNRWRRCPNPECSHLLSDADVNDLQCSRCRK